MNDLSLYEKIAPLAGNYPIRLHIQDARETIDAHWHEYLELLFFRTDGCTVRCGSQLLTPRRGDCVVVNCNELHAISPPLHGRLLLPDDQSLIFCRRFFSKYPAAKLHYR